MLKPADAVVRQEQQMHMRFVGRVVLRRNAAEGVLALEFADELFDPRPLIVEAPHGERSLYQVRHQDLIVVPFELPQGQLWVVLVGLIAPDNYKAKQLGPPM